MSQNFDVIIIGGGAAGLMCAIESGKRGRRTLVIEHCDKVGKKILISGGGRCNFTNYHAGPHAYISENVHFCKSALSRYSQFDFLNLLEQYAVEITERKHGQLFCTRSARDIVDMLLNECRLAGVEIRCNCRVKAVSKARRFVVETIAGQFTAQSLVIATGGVSIPKMGATDFGYRLAEQFGLQLTERRPGLVPLTFDKDYLKYFRDLSGISVDAKVSCADVSFRENILITHRGVSGPSILQISSYWRKGITVSIDLLPDDDLEQLIAARRSENGNTEVKTLISQMLPKRLVQRIFEVWLPNKQLKQLTHAEIVAIIQFFHHWEISPIATEGFRVAEVTVGGVDVNQISSKTFESKRQPGLFWIGEVLDVTGWLGGYNFQWAWASGFCAGQYV